MHQISAKYTRQQAFQEAEQQEINESNNPEHNEKHHVTSHATSNSINIYSFVQGNSSDPAKMVGLPTCSICTNPSKSPIARA